jgi:hypothetical protein
MGDQHNTARSTEIEACALEFEYATNLINEFGKACPQKITYSDSCKTLIEALEEDEPKKIAEKLSNHVEEVLKQTNLFTEPAQYDILKYLWVQEQHQQDERAALANGDVFFHSADDISLVPQQHLEESTSLLKTTDYYDSYSAFTVDKEDQKNFAFNKNCAEVTEQSVKKLLSQERQKLLPRHSKDLNEAINTLNQAIRNSVWRKKGNLVKNLEARHIVSNYDSNLHYHHIQNLNINMKDEVTRTVSALNCIDAAIETYNPLSDDDQKKSEALRQELSGWINEYVDTNSKVIHCIDEALRAYKNDSNNNDSKKSQSAAYWQAVIDAIQLDLTQDWSAYVNIGLQSFGATTHSMRTLVKNKLNEKDILSGDKLVYPKDTTEAKIFQLIGLKKELDKKKKVKEEIESQKKCVTENFLQAIDDLRSSVEQKIETIVKNREDKAKFDGIEKFEIMFDKNSSTKDRFAFNILSRNYNDLSKRVENKLNEEQKSRWNAIEEKYKKWFVEYYQQECEKHAHIYNEFGDALEKIVKEGKEITEKCNPLYNNHKVNDIIKATVKVAEDTQIKCNSLCEDSRGMPLVNSFTTEQKNLYKKTTVDVCVERINGLHKKQEELEKIVVKTTGSLRESKRQLQQFGRSAFGRLRGFLDTVRSVIWTFVGLISEKKKVSRYQKGLGFFSQYQNRASDLENSYSDRVYFTSVAAAGAGA